MRRTSAILAAALAVLAGPAGAHAQAPKADRDRDGVFDDLEAQLLGDPGDARVRVLVATRGDATPDRVDGLEREVGGFVLRRRFGAVDGFAATVTKAQVRALAAQDGVRHVEQDAVVRATNGAAQTSAGVTAARAQVPGLDGDGDGTPSAYTGDDLVAAVIDTGIDAAHAALDGGKVLHFRDYVNAGGAATAPYDDHDHGTHVAGTIAGDGDGSTSGADQGVAPRAALVGLKVLAANGSGYASSTIAALDWIVRQGAAYGIEVVNLSLGAAGCNAGSDLSSQAVDAAGAAGLVVVVAAGNSGPGTCTVGSPGAARGALTVGNMADGGRYGPYLAPSSSRGPTSDGRTKPDVAAPGVGIRSPDAGTAAGYRTMTGTSMAAPFVAGTALLMLERTPSLTPAGVKARIMGTAVDWARGGDNLTVGTSGPDADYGAGRLDAYAAISAAGTALASPPAAPAHHIREGEVAAGGSVSFAVTAQGGGTTLATTLIQPSGKAAELTLEVLTSGGSVVRTDTTGGTRQAVSLVAASAGELLTLRVRSTSGSTPFFLDVSGATRSDPDVTAPDTELLSGPSGPVATASPTFAFRASESGSTFECRLDGGSFTACTSPVTTAALADGAHTFDVRAIDAAGNADGSPASRAFTVDTAAPETAIDAGPSGTVATSSASLSFSSPDADAGFECRLNGSAWEACTSPRALSGLGEGPSTFEVRAVDAVGNRDATPAERTWSVDTDAPETTLTGGPAGTVPASSASFTFVASEEPAGFECRLDNGAWTACTSPHALDGLADGGHAFAVRAVDAVGNADATPASRAWVVDTSPPETTLDSGPDGTSRTSTATFTFSSSERASYECRLDGSPWAPCTTPHVLAALADGPHAFEVRGVDAAGNVDATPARRSWTVDTVAPETVIDAGPSGVVASASAGFVFSAVDAERFECRLDGGVWEACTSPRSLDGLADGEHVFEVRAFDAVGNGDATPASRSWEVDTTPPQTTITAGPAGAVASASASFAFTASEAGSFECRLDGGGWTPCSSPQALAGLAEGEHTFEVRAADARGTTDLTPATRTWVVDTSAPQTTVLDGPSGTVASSSATVTFAASEEGRFECRLDDGAWGPCSSPWTRDGLADGEHVFEVRAVDAAGNVDATPARRSWTVDTVAPETTIDAGPPTASTATSATFAFSASEPATFECRLDDAPWTACASPHEVSGLAVGPHVLEVRATDAPGTTDPSPAVHRFTVRAPAPPPDTEAPETSLHLAPAGTTSSSSATFGFSATEDGASFECRLDGAAWAACTSPLTLHGLGDGPHLLEVRARDAAGNADASPASAAFTVRRPPPPAPTPTATATPAVDDAGAPQDTTAPAARARVRPVSRRALLRRGARVTLRCNEACRVVVTLKLPRSRGRAPVVLARRTAALPAGRPRAATLRLHAAARRAVRRRRPAAILVQVTVRDEAGNRRTTTRRVRLAR